MFKVARNLLFLIVIISILAACNLPSSKPSHPGSKHRLYRRSLDRAGCQLTQAAPFSTPTLPPPAATNTSVQPSDTACLHAFPCSFRHAGL